MKTNKCSLTVNKFCTKEDGGSRLSIREGLILLFLLFYSAHYSFAQIDSLKKQLSSVSNLTNELELLIEITSYYNNQYLCDSVFHYSDQYLDKLPSKQSKQAADMMNIRMACLLNSTDAKKKLEEAIFAENLDTTVAPIVELNYIAWRYRASAYSDMDSIGLASDALDKTLAYAIETDKNSFIMAAYGMLAFFYEDFFVNQEETVLKYAKNIYNLSKSIVQENPNKTSTINLYISADYLGRSFLEAGQLDSAIYYFQEALEINTANVGVLSPFYEALTKTEYSKCLLIQGKLKKALSMIETATLLMESTNDEKKIYHTLLIAAEIYQSLRLDTKANVVLEKAKKYHQQFDDKKLAIDLYALLTEAERSRNPRQALIYKEHELALRDSILQADNTMEVARMEAQFQFKNERRELTFQQNLQQEKIAQQQLQLALGGALFLTVSLITFLMYRNNRYQQLLNEQLLESQQKLEQNNLRLNHFVRSLSHDVMGKLESILTTSNLIQVNHLQTMESQNYYDNTKKSISWLRDYCKDLLLWSEKNFETESLTTSQTDLSLIVEDILKAYKAELNIKNFDLIIDELPKVKMPKAPVQQVFKNLIDNAIKYNKDQERPKLRISSIAERSGWTICIKDNGVGFPSSDRQKIFQVTTDKTQIHGRGLSYIKSLLLEYEEVIWADNNEWGGASFYFTVR